METHECLMLEMDRNAVKKSWSAILAFSAQRAISLPSLGQRPRKCHHQASKCLKGRPFHWNANGRPVGPLETERTPSWADGPGYVNGWAFGPEPHENTGPKHFLSLGEKLRTAWLSGSSDYSKCRTKETVFRVLREIDRNSYEAAMRIALLIGLVLEVFPEVSRAIDVANFAGIFGRSVAAE
jgi:hypothetical protein